MKKHGSVFFEISRELFSIISFDGIIKSANPAFCTATGYRLSDLLDINLIKFIHPEDETKAVTYLNSLAKGKYNQSSKLRFRQKDGTYIFLSWRGVISAKDSLIYFTAQDLTDDDPSGIRNQPERLLLTQKIDQYLSHADDSDEFIASVIEIVCEHLGWKYGAYWKHEPDSNVLKLNNHWTDSKTDITDFLAISKNTLFTSGVGLPGRVWKSLTSHWIVDVNNDSNFPRAPFAKKAGLHSAFAFPITVGKELLGVLEFFSYYIEKPDTSLLMDAKGIGIRIGQFIMKKAAEEELKQLMFAVDQSASLTITDSNKRLLYINDNFIKTSGYSKKEIIGKENPLFSSNQEDQTQPGQIWNTINAGKIWKGHIKSKKKNNQTYWENVVIIPYKDKEGRISHFISTSSDITLQKKAEDLLDYQRAALLQTAKMTSLGEMAGGIAHEINNPLAVIQGKATQLRRQIMQSKYDENTALLMLEKIESTTQRISKIIKGLRSFARNAEHDPFDTVSIKSVIDDTLSFCSEKFKDQCIAIEVKCDVDIKVECRPTQISQVMLNLLHNSFDAIQENQEKWIKIEVLQKTDDSIELRLTDSGKGIPKDIAEKIMLPFFTTKEVGKGTGLGLSISRGILENHKGSLGIDHSVPNTCFVLILPVKQPNLEMEAA